MCSVWWMALKWHPIPRKLNDSPNNVNKTQNTRTAPPEGQSFYTHIPLILLLRLNIRNPPL